ncbi:MAG: DUF4179 domain-containing protein [Lachnospiraceae bacterium]
MVNHNHTNLEELLKAACEREVSHSEYVEERIEEAYDIIRNSKSKRHSLSYLSKAGIAAAILLAVTALIGVSNPVLAAKIPVIGKIFSLIESQVSYPGEYSEHAVDLKEDSEGAELREKPEDISDSSGEKPYSVKDGELEITLSEVSYDSNAIYLSVQITNDHDFPDDLLSTDLLYLRCLAAMKRSDGTLAEFSESTGNMPAYRMDGKYVDKHTFVGALKLELEDVSSYTSGDLTILEVSQDLTTGDLKSGELGDSGETVTYLENDKVIYTGEWKFTIPINQSEAGDAETEIPVQDTNQDGYGIEKIIKTRYEIYAVPILPEQTEGSDYIVTMWDANGEPLDFHGDNAEIFSTYGRDVSEITVYLLKWDDFVECKGTNYKMQPERAVYQKTMKLEQK